MTSRFAPLLVLMFVLILPGSSLAFLISGRPAVIKWSPFHSPEKSPETLTAKPDMKQKTPDTDRQAAFIDFLTEEIKKETLFPARIAEIVDRKNESFLALEAHLARLHNSRNQTRPSSLDTDDLARPPGAAFGLNLFDPTQSLYFLTRSHAGRLENRKSRLMPHNSGYRLR